MSQRNSEMKENCCEDYNLSLPFSTDQQICTKWNFYTITDTKNRERKKKTWEGFALGASVLSQQVHSVPIWLHYLPRHSHSSYTEGGNFKLCFGNICPLNREGGRESDFILVYFPPISFQLKFPSKCDHLSISVNTVQSQKYHTCSTSYIVLLPSYYVNKNFECVHNKNKLIDHPT